MKCCITGHTRGIGKDFYDHFVSKGWDVKGFDSKTDWLDIIKLSVGCDIFINNAYANGRQIDFLNQLYASVGKMIISGSVAAFYPDPKMPVYSNHKKELVERFRVLGRSNILMLHLSAKGYNDRETLLKLVDLWLEHPHITEIGFDPTGEPNG